jgi:hypothetical protein
VRLDFTSTRTRSYAFVLILDQQLLDRRLAKATHQFNLLDLNEKPDLPGDWDRLCKHDIVLEDIRKRSIPISALEWCRCELGISHAILTFGQRKTYNHLVHQNTESPPIDRRGVATPFDDFWRDILFRPDKRVCPKVGDTRSRIHQHSLDRQDVALH